MPPEVTRTPVGIVGGGPAGLMLSHLLAQAGIDSVVVELRTRDEIEHTHRAGILEQDSVRMLVESGVSDRVLSDGYRHEGIDLAFGGEGHTLGIHASDEQVIARLSTLPASRMPINTPSLFGGMGYSTSIGPSFMLGTGTWSGSLTSDNVSPLHLINIKRLAYEVRPWRGLYETQPQRRTS